MGEFSPVYLILSGRRAEFTQFYRKDTKRSEEIQFAINEVEQASKKSNNSVDAVYEIFYTIKSRMEEIIGEIAEIVSEISSIHKIGLENNLKIAQWNRDVSEITKLDMNTPAG